MLLQREKLPSKLKQVVTFMQTDKKSAKRDFVCSSAPKANSLKIKLSKVKTLEHGKHSNTVNDGAWLWDPTMNAVNLIN